MNVTCRHDEIYYLYYSDVLWHYSMELKKWLFSGLSCSGRFPDLFMAVLTGINPFLRLLSRVSMCRRIWWGFWQLLQGWEDLHSFRKWPAFKQFMHSPLLFAIDSLWSCDICHLNKVPGSNFSWIIVVHSQWHPEHASVAVGYHVTALTPFHFHLWVKGFRLSPWCDSVV